MTVIHSTDSTTTVFILLSSTARVTANSIGFEVEFRR
jgi:hypothetical protein